MNQTAHTLQCTPGSICDCGKLPCHKRGILCFLLTLCPAITAIEEKARFCRDTARSTKLREEYKIPFYTDEENIEIITRSMVRKVFSDLFGSSLAIPDLQALKRVLFDAIYPCHGGQT